MAILTFTPDERLSLRDNYRRLIGLCADLDEEVGLKELKSIISHAITDDKYIRDKHGINPIVHDLTTAVTFCERVSPDRNIVIALLAYRMCNVGVMNEKEVVKRWGDDVGKLVHGLLKVATLYGKNANAAVVSDNFRRLLMTFAEDIRVIIMMIVERLTLLKSINHHPDEGFVRDIAYEANYLYAPLAHRLGLYAIKSELEDMSLKYTNRKTYTDIARISSTAIR